MDVLIDVGGGGVRGIHDWQVVIEHPVLLGNAEHVWREHSVRATARTGLLDARVGGGGGGGEMGRACGGRRGLVHLLGFGVLEVLWSLFQGVVGRGMWRSSHCLQIQRSWKRGLEGK